MGHYTITETDLGRLRKRKPVLAMSKTAARAEVIPIRGTTKRRALLTGPWLRLERGDMAALERGERLRSPGGLNTLRLAVPRRRKNGPVVRRALRRALTGA